MFAQKHGSRMKMVLIYVDDIILIGHDLVYLAKITSMLNSFFALNYLGGLSFLLGIEITPSQGQPHLNQRKYILDY